MSQILEKELYKSDHSFFSKSNYTIKTVEQGLEIHRKRDEEEFNILSKKYVLKRNNKYNFLQLGSVQVAAKPLHKLRLNNTIFMTFKDSMCTKFYKSIWGIVETSFSQGLVWYNCFPNITINVKESYEGPILVLNTKLYGYDMKPRTIPMTIIYRV